MATTVGIEVLDPATSRLPGDSAETCPRVSVVIPNYNHTRYLPGAIGSVLAQTRRPLEIIVVDDGSTDDCRETVAAFGGQVRYVFQENQGLAGARNTGIRMARGNLVGLLDADDQWLPEFLAAMCSLAESDPGAAVYYARAQAVDESGQRLPQVLGGCPIPPDALYLQLLRANFLIPSAVVVRRSAVMSAGLFDSSLRSCEDWDLWLRLLPAQRFVGTDAPLILYRLHGQTLSTNLAGMHGAARAVVTKHFGPDDGSPERWSANKRRAYGGLYRYLLLTSVQRRADEQAWPDILRRALQADPSLSADVAFFYELALGDQPPGHRGSARHLALRQNAERLWSLLQAAFAGREAGPLAALRDHTVGTALYSTGLVAYNTGERSLSRRFLLRSLYYRPALARDGLLLGDLAKSFLHPGLVRRIRRHGTHAGA